LSIEEAGIMTIENLDAGYVRRFVFSIANVHQRLGIVKRIFISVLDVRTCDWGGSEGSMGRFRAVIQIDPRKIGEYVVATDHKYAQGEADRFVVDLLTTEWGFVYFLRVGVLWYDSVEKLDRTAQSKVLVARYPKNHEPKDTRNSIKEQPTEISDRLVFEHQNRDRARVLLYQQIREIEARHGEVLFKHLEQNV
jgi:hypothetical protein